MPTSSLERTLMKERHDLLVLNRKLDGSLTRAIALLRRFEACCHSSTDIDLADDVIEYLEEVDGA